MRQEQNVQLDLPAGWAPYALAGAPDGSVWMTLLTPAALARFDPEIALSGADPVAAVRCHPITGEAVRPMQVTVGSDGALWYTRTDDRLGRREANSEVHGAETLIELAPGAAPYGITTAPDGGVWFTAPGLDQIGRRGVDGEIRMIDLPVSDGRAAMVTVAADATVWVALNGAGALARCQDGAVDLVDLPAGSAPVGLAAGDDGIWYADISGGRVGHVDPAGIVGQVTFDDPLCRPHAVAADPDGGCWVTLWGSGQLARVTATGDVTRHPLPGQEPHGLLVTDTHVWVAMESGALVAVARSPGSE